MLADFHIPPLSNDMKIGKNDLGGPPFNFLFVFFVHFLHYLKNESTWLSTFRLEEAIFR